MPPSLFRFRASCSLLFLCGALVSPASAETSKLAKPTLDSSSHLETGGDTVESISGTRTRQVLNGLWRFQPATNTEGPDPAAPWANIRVPGSWYLQDVWDQVRLLPGFEEEPPEWAGTKSFTLNNPRRVYVDGVSRAWYQREVRVSEMAPDRDLVLILERVSTDAVVRVNGRKVGEIHWPGGEVTLTEHVKSGAAFTLEVLVLATPSEKDLLIAMRDDYSDRGQGGLRSAGIIGDVLLETRPRGARLDGVAIETSVRNRTITLRPELAGEPPAGPVAFVATVKTWPEGEVVKTWEKTIKLGSGGVLASELSFPWADPKLWDVGQPHLYTLELSASGRGWSDAWRERFGFREFRIQGREFLLNEKPIRFRPNGSGADQVGVSEAGARAELERQLGLGFTLLEIWPNDNFRRSFPDGRPSYAHQADEVGMPLMFPLIRPDDLFHWSKPSDETAAPRARWLEANRALVKRVRNHPAIFMYLFFGNEFMTADDQNPLRLGRRSALDASQNKNVAPAKALLESLRALDGTRPVTSHSGAAVGDIQTVNHYLGITPLQEREEMLSAWAKDGDMPYMAVEFASPFGGDMNRARQSWNTGSERLLTEFFAGWHGPAAYEVESSEYRENLAKSFRGGFDFGDWPQHMNYPPFVEQQAGDSESVWRAWRTWGVSGGMIQWEKPFDATPGRSEIDMPAWKPGLRGTWMAKLPGGYLATADQVKSGLSAAGRRFFAMQSPALAYLAGEPGAWPDKGRNFFSGEIVRKQVALINDTRAPVDFALTWRAELPGGGTVAEGVVKGTMAVSEIGFRPIEFTMPSVIAPTAVTLTLAGRAGEHEQNDRFVLTALPKPAPATTEVASRYVVFDPEGVSTAWLRTLGYRTITLTERLKEPVAVTASRDVLVIGRHALERGGWPEGFDLRSFVEQGGRAVLLGQSPDFLRERAGLRVHRWVGRAFFPVGSQAEHPLLNNLGAELFRDWRGSGSLVPEARDTALLPVRSTYPRFGYGWGTRGSVSSAAWEKPHFSAWTPLLEGEFDLAYSPLLELRFGHGLLVYCGLDLEARGASEPMAAEMTRRVLDYTSGATLTAPTPVYLLGAEDTFKAWQLIGESVTGVPAKAGLLVVAADANPSSESIRAFLRQGGNVFFLPRAEGSLPLGLTAETGAFDRGDVPAWPESRGVSVAELRARTTTPLALITRGPSGVEIGAGGALARVREGRGTAIFCQIDAAALDTEKLTYLRYSAWRFTRATSQILANMGAAFSGDVSFFALKKDPFQPIDLVRDWRVKEEVKLPSAPSPDQPSKDPGNRGFEQKWHLPASDDADWAVVPMPSMLTGQAGIDWQSSNGAAWFRLKFAVPAEWADKGPAVLHLGTLDDGDITYLNGASIGRTLPSKDSWNKARSYKLPVWAVKAGVENTLAVRVFNQFGGGGFGAPRQSLVLRLELQSPPSVSRYYIPGFRNDQPMGDDPARYTRW